MGYTLASLAVTFESRAIEVPPTVFLLLLCFLQVLPLDLEANPPQGYKGLKAESAGSTRAAFWREVDPCLSGKCRR